jgi:hypothetical protein
MSKMGSHEPFGFPKTQLMPKRRGGNQIVNLTPDH